MSNLLNWPFPLLTTFIVSMTANPAIAVNGLDCTGEYRTYFYNGSMGEDFKKPEVKDVNPTRVKSSDVLVLAAEVLFLAKGAVVKEIGRLHAQTFEIMTSNYVKTDDFGFLSQGPKNEFLQVLPVSDEWSMRTIYLPPDDLTSVITTYSCEPKK